MCVLFIYTISISIVCVSQKELTITESNQQTSLLKESNFQKTKTLCKEIYDISKSFIQCSYASSCCQHITGGVNINLHGCVSLMVPECALSLLCL